MLVPDPVLHAGEKKDIPSVVLGGVCRACVKIPVPTQPYTTLDVSFTEINQENDTSRCL